MQPVKTVILTTETAEIVANRTWSPTFEVDISEVNSYMYFLRESKRG